MERRSFSRLRAIRFPGWKGARFRDSMHNGAAQQGCHAVRDEDQWTFLGNVQSTCGAFVVTDPVLDRSFQSSFSLTTEDGKTLSAPLALVIRNVADGEWVARRKTGGSLRLCSKDLAGRALRWERYALRVATFTGQVGVYNACKYPPGWTGEWNNVRSFYGMNCFVTKQRHKGGVLADTRMNGIGAVSDTGGKNGLWDVMCGTCVDTGRVAAVWVRCGE